MIESAIESACVAYAARQGILSYKLQAGVTGVPDRMFLLPGGRAWMVEMKTSTGRLSPRQKWVHGELALAGHPVTIIRSLLEFKEALTPKLKMM